MIKLPGADARNEDAPDIAPAIVIRVELDDFVRLRIVHIVIQQQPHARRAATIDDELDTVLVENGAVRQHVSELESRMDVSHEHAWGLDRLVRCSSRNWTRKRTRRFPSRPSGSPI